MTDIRRLAPPRAKAKDTDEPATNAAKFLAKRGHVVMKQIREAGKVQCDYGTSLSFSTLVFAIAQGLRGDRTFGLRIEHQTLEEGSESCLIDFDELKELLLAIKHLLTVAKQYAAERTDYTEFEYITRDALKVGFYQDTDGQQQAFFDVSPGGAMMFLSFEQLKEVFEIIKKGREYLMEKGAGVDAVITQA